MQMFLNVATLACGEAVSRQPAVHLYYYRRLSSKFEEFLALRSQFDSDLDQIWQACADRSGNGSYVTNWSHEWPGRVGSLGPSFEARLLMRARHLTYPRYTAKL